MRVTEGFAGFPFQEFLLFLAEKSPACRYYDIKKDLTLTGISGSPRRRHRLGMKREIVVYTVDYWLFHILPEVRKTCFTLARAGIASDLVNVTVQRCGGASGPDKCVSSPSTERHHPADKDLHIFRLRLQPMQMRQVEKIPPAGFSVCAG